MDVAIKIRDQPRSRKPGKPAQISSLIRQKVAVRWDRLHLPMNECYKPFNRGVSDTALQENVFDKVGASPAYHDTFVNVTAA